MLLSVSDVFVSFRKKSRWFARAGKHRVLKGVSLGLKPGECLGLVGESGSGKSTLGRVIIGSQKPDRGLVVFDRKEMYNKAERQDILGRISVVFQDYSSSVNPFFSVRDIIAEPMKAARLEQAGSKEYVVELLEQVGLSGDHLKRRAHELSGGQLQRVCLARAISTRPKMLLLDEAVSSLDVSVSMQILDLLIKLKESHKLSYFFITHDLTVVTYICDRVLFFDDGRVVEEARSLAGLKEVKEKYSRKLLNSAAGLDWLGRKPGAPA